MNLANILAKIAPIELPSMKDPPDLKDIIKNNIGSAYPDNSRYIDDLISVAYYITSNEPWLVTYSGWLFRRQFFVERFYFDNGMLTALHRHNYIELVYVIEGQLHLRISGRDEIFSQGEICLIDKDSIHGEYFYRERAVIAFLGISNSFFDDFMHIDTEDSLVVNQMSIKSFLHDVIMKRKKKYRFLRFIPKVKSPKTIHLFQQTILEIARHQVGSYHIVIGLTERLLSLLPLEYHIVLEKQTDINQRRLIFDDVQLYMQQHYRDISMNRLISLFGHNIDYFNRLIKYYTRLTYSKFLQNMRLERAEYLLKTTQYRIEDIAHQVGYENIGYFYRIFYEKYHVTPRVMRKGDPR